jgi:hypothetical protein
MKVSNAFSCAIQVEYCSGQVNLEIDRVKALEINPALWL